MNNNYMNINENKSRREFLKTCGMISAGVVVTTVAGSILTSCERDEVIPYIPPPPGAHIDVDLTKYATLQTIGGFAKIPDQKLNDGSYINGSKKMVAKRISSTEFLVMTSECTHISHCELDMPATPNGDLPCPCHSVVFSFQLSTKGQVVLDPQSTGEKQALKVFNTEFISPSTLRIFA